MIFAASARQQLEASKQMKVKRCYTFVTDYDEENDNLPDMMKSIGRMYIHEIKKLLTLVDFMAPLSVRKK